MDRRHPIINFEPHRFADFFGDLSSNLDARLLSGGACNSNYLVRTQQGEQYVCRIHSRGNPAAEQSVTNLLNPSIPAPEYLWTGEGISIISFVEGSHFSPTKKLMREAGRIIGEMRTISFEEKGRILASGEVTPFENWDSFEAGILNLLENESVKIHLPEDTLTALKRLLLQHHPVLESFNLCRNLVHGDFRPDNILVSGDRITGILDWEFAHSGCSYMDIGNLLRHLSSEWEKDLSQGLREAGFDLPTDWRFRSLLIDLASHLEFLTSNRSLDFKNECVGRINTLIAASP